MTAYLISEVEVADPDGWDRYAAIAAPAIGRYGGRYLVRRASPEVAERDWPDVQPPDQQVIVVEFPTMDALHRWYGSADYAPALSIRKTAVKRRLLFVHGVDEQGAT
jgi:uncharacterized protein (DUF1330 family)